MLNGNPPINQKIRSVTLLYFSLKSIFFDLSLNLYAIFYLAKPVRNLSSSVSSELLKIGLCIKKENVPFFVLFKKGQLQESEKCIVFKLFFKKRFSADFLTFRPKKARRTFFFDFFDPKFFFLKSVINFATKKALTWIAPPI